MWPLTPSKSESENESTISSVDLEELTKLVKKVCSNSLTPCAVLTHYLLNRMLLTISCISWLVSIVSGFLRVFQVGPAASKMPPTPLARAWTSAL